MAQIDINVEYLYRLMDYHYGLITLTKLKLCFTTLNSLFLMFAGFDRLFCGQCCLRTQNAVTTEEHCLP